MTEHPSFVCKREGHHFTVKTTVTSTIAGATIVRECERCGRQIVEDVPVVAPNTSGAA